MTSLSAIPMQSETHDDFPLGDVYLDSSVMIAAMIDGLPLSSVCLAFCNRLIAHNNHVYFSQILRLEIAEAVRKLATRQQLPEEFWQAYQLHEWGSNRLVRQQWMAFGMSQFTALIGKFAEVVELPLRHRLWRQSVQLMGEYGLGSNDAVHVATALQNGLRDFVTGDRRFNRVDTLAIWLLRDNFSHSQ